MEFSKRMGATARKLIIKYGAVIQLHKARTEGFYEKGTHREYWIVDDKVTYIPPDDAVYVGYATIHSPKHYEMTDGRIISTDIVFRCVDIPEPTTNDTIEWRGDKYNIIFVKPAVVQDDSIVHTVFARQA